jgi:hypothetical protein
MTIWEKIIEAQTNRQGKASYIEDEQEVQIIVKQNGWYEGFVSFA